MRDGTATKPVPGASRVVGIEVMIRNRDHDDRAGRFTHELD